MRIVRATDEWPNRDETCWPSRWPHQPDHAPAIPPRLLPRSLRHQGLREGAALKALLFDDLQLEVLSQFGEWAVPAPIAIGTVVSWYSSTRPRRVNDWAKVGPPLTRTVPAGRRRRPPRLLVHRGGDRPVRRGPVRTHDLVAAAAHRMDAGLLQRAAVPRTRVLAEPLEHPLMGPVGAGGKIVEGQDHLENHFSIAHVPRDRTPRVKSHCPSVDSGYVGGMDGPRASW